MNNKIICVWGIALFAILAAIPTLLTATAVVPEIKLKLELVFAITGLLAIAYLVLRQKK